MSNEDLEKLADLIVDKLVEKQKKMDEEYMQQMLDEQESFKSSEEYEVKHFYTLSSKDETNEDLKREKKIEELEEALQNAIQQEDYMRASDIQTNLTRLRDQGN